MGQCAPDARHNRQRSPASCEALTALVIQSSCLARESFRGTARASRWPYCTVDLCFSSHLVEPTGVVLTSVAAVAFNLPLAPPSAPCCPAALLLCCTLCVVCAVCSRPFLAFAWSAISLQSCAVRNSVDFAPIRGFLLRTSGPESSTPLRVGLLGAPMGNVFAPDKIHYQPRERLVNMFSPAKCR